MGETRVDLLHLLEDLRDAYPGSLEETILTEIVANALDSGASRIELLADGASRTLTVTDNGSGMSRQALSRYHDLAATTKRKGRSIGFAGVGIKLGLLTSDEVLTETRRARSHLATSWRLTSKSRAPWRWVEPPGFQQEEGTSVRLYLRNALSELLDAGFLETALTRHFQPLLDPDFGEILRLQYPAGVSFVVNGRAVPRFGRSPERVGLGVRLGRQRKPSGIGYLIRSDDVAEDERGVAISTLGKVIKRGWDWLGLSPADTDRISGLVEVPPLVEALTLNKADFVRTGARGATFLAYRKALQEVVAAQLAAWGDTPRTPDARPRRTRALERDLQSVLADLTDHYPILSTLVERSRGGQHRLPLGGDGRKVGALADDSGVASAAENVPGAPADDGAPPPPTASEPPEPPHVAEVDPLGSRAPKVPARLGLRIDFESRPDDAELGVLRESTVWINDAHPAYKRAVASRSEGYHLALAVSMALARVAVEQQEFEAFITDFLSTWGAADGGR
jgi:molecular chaperone HtpG